MRLTRPVARAVPIFASLSVACMVEASCPPDLDGDHAVGPPDLAALLSAWGPCGKSCAADLDADGSVGPPDLASLLGSWGACPLDWATVLEESPDPAVVTNASLRDAISATGLPWRVRDDATGIEMLLVPPGTFNMGCSPSSGSSCAAHENPVRAVTLTRAFYLGRYEVRQSEWIAAMGFNPSRFQPPTEPDFEQRPTEGVSWSLAQKFLSRTGLRLPTEAEWEWACRAGTATAYHGSTAAPDGSTQDGYAANIAWHYHNSGFRTRPVGGKLANSLGFHDMSGNVAEWVNDRYSASYHQAGLSIDPPGPAVGNSRVLRGGDYQSYQIGLCRSSARDKDSVSWAWTRYGVRVARSPRSGRSISSIAPATGSTLGGTSVTIRGTGFTGNETVFIDGFEASSVTVVDSTTINAILGPGEGGVWNVRVASAYGSPAILEEAFTYEWALPWATVLEVEPDPSIVTNPLLREAIIRSRLPWRVRDIGTQIEMLAIPPGQFLMGCTPPPGGICFWGEEPVHPVVLTRGFYLGRFEVTQAQWQAMTGTNPSEFQGEGYPDAPNRPVEMVYRATAENVLSQRGLRLPTEAEWEYACRAGTTTTFHGFAGHPDGTDDPALMVEVAWIAENNGEKGTPTYGTKPVGQKPPNGFGLHDMAGNVEEWIKDDYTDFYYDVSPVVNPPGPYVAFEPSPAVRGGAWRWPASVARSGGRMWGYSYEVIRSHLGLRAARTP